MNSDTKQLYYSDRTFDIIPNAVTPRNYNLERGIFNQASELEYKNPEKRKYIKNTISNPTINQYKNPYAISHNDFYDNDTNSISRKVDKRNRTNIFDQRLSAKSQYINQYQNKKHLERFNQIDQQNPNAQKMKTIKRPNDLTFEEYLNFKRKMAQHEGNPKY